MLRKFLIAIAEMVCDGFRLLFYSAAAIGVVCVMIILLAAAMAIVNYMR